MQAITDMQTLPLHRERTWPLDARMAMFVLETGGQDPQVTRDRSAPRHPCRIMGTVVTDNPKALGQKIVYVRDMNTGHLGFISQNELPVGAKLLLNCLGDHGVPERMVCKVSRSRSFMKGWHEGVLRVCE